MARSHPLSRNSIALAAIELLDTEGVDAFSLRRVAEHLGSGTMSLYRHVANRDDLIVAIAEEIFDRPFESASLHDEWPDRVRATANAARSTALTHPAAVIMIMSTLPLEFLAIRGLTAMRLGDSDLDETKQGLVAQTVLPFLAGWCLAEAHQFPPGDEAAANQFGPAIDAIIAGLQA